MGFRIWDKVFPKAKNNYRFEYPTRCPDGHTQISWSSDENDVYCWLCNRAYVVSECFSEHRESHESGLNRQAKGIH